VPRPSYPYGIIWNEGIPMYANCFAIRTIQPFPRLPSFETGWLFCAASLVIAAIVVLLVPQDAITWAIAHLG
jgi:hypothetical protein